MEVSIELDRCVFCFAFFFSFYLFSLFLSAGLGSGSTIVNAGVIGSPMARVKLWNTQKFGNLNLDFVKIKDPNC